MATGECSTKGCTKIAEEGWRHCWDCDSVQYYAKHLRTLLARRPELRQHAREQLGAVVQPKPYKTAGPRPDWRNDRRDVYVPFELRSCVRIVATEIADERVSLSAALRYIIRDWWKHADFNKVSMPGSLLVEDGEIKGWADDKEVQE